MEYRKNIKFKKFIFVGSVWIEKRFRFLFDLDFYKDYHDKWGFAFTGGIFGVSLTVMVHRHYEEEMLQ
jgi:hypothetical protein